MTSGNELVVKLVISLASLAMLAWRAYREDDEVSADLTLTGLAAIAMIAYTNFLTFHYTARSFTHGQDMFHYQLGSKYFPELGYEHLYEASVVAQVESAPGSVLPQKIRNLTTNAVVPVSEAIARSTDTIALFSPARWRTFVADHSYLAREARSWTNLRDIRLDHGYNPSPAWTFVARVFNSWLPLNAITVPLLALLDWILVGAILVVVSRIYGGAIAATLAILLGLGHLWGYAWIGGAFLRFDWFAAVVIGICMLKRGTYGTAGALFAYATAVRIFPVLLLVGVGVVATRDLVRRQDTRWLLRFGGAFVGCLAVCFFAGALAGRGFAAWEQFATNIRKHNATWAINRAGLEVLFLYNADIRWPSSTYDVDVVRHRDGSHVVSVPALGLHATAETFEKAVALAQNAISSNDERWQAEMRSTQARRRPLYLIAAALLVAAVILAAWQRPVDEAALLGVAVIFALLSLDGYYFVIFVVMALDSKRSGSLGLLALNVATLAAALVTPMLHVAHEVFSFGILAVLGVVIWPDVISTLFPNPAMALRGTTATVDRGKRAASITHGQRIRSRRRVRRK